MPPIALSLLLLSACQFGLAVNRGPRIKPPNGSGSAAFNLCGSPDGARAAGTWDDPIVMGTMPFVDAGDTTDGADEASGWDCGRVDRSGKEVVYALTVTEDRTFLRADVTPADGVVVSLQLVKDGQLVDGSVTGCVASSADHLQVPRLDPGDYQLVVDTVVTGDGTEQAGAYTLFVEAAPYGEWQDTNVADGVVWERWRDYQENVVNANWNVLKVDLKKRSVTPRPHEGCTTVPTAGEGFGAIAGINGGFGDDGCESLDLLRADGVTFSRNTYANTQPVIGWDADGTSELAQVASDDDYDARRNAIGGYPQIIADGSIAIDPDGTDDFYVTPSARTALATTAHHELLLVTADGGTQAADGLTIADMARMLLDLGAVNAIGLDGGGATTTWIPGCSATGVVNFPVDGGGTERDGAQPVSDGVYVF